MTPETVYQRFRKKRITTVTRLEYDKTTYLIHFFNTLYYSFISNYVTLVQLSLAY